MTISNKVFAYVQAFWPDVLCPLRAGWKNRYEDRDADARASARMKWGLLAENMKT